MSVSPMSEQQQAVLAFTAHTLVRTLFGGELVVRDQDGEVYELLRDGRLLPHVELERVRWQPEVS